MTCSTNEDCNTGCCVIEKTLKGVCRPADECVPPLAPESSGSYTTVEADKEGHSKPQDNPKISTTVGVLPHDEDEHDDPFHHHSTHAPKVFTPTKHKEYMDHLFTLNKKCCGGKERAADAENALNRHGRCCGGGGGGGGGNMQYTRDESGALVFKRESGLDKSLHRPQRCCSGKRDLNEDPTKDRSRRCCGGGINQRSAEADLKRPQRCCGAKQNQRSADPALNRPQRCCGNGAGGYSQRDENGLYRPQRCCGGGGGGGMGRTERGANGETLNRPQRCCGGGGQAYERSADESVSRPQVRSKFHTIFFHFSYHYSCTINALLCCHMRVIKIIPKIMFT